MPTVALVARIISLRGSEHVVELMLAAYAQQVRAESGNLVFAPNALVDDGRTFVVYEEYADEAAFQAHLGSQHNADFNRRLASHVKGGGSELTNLRPVGDGA